MLIREEQSETAEELREIYVQFLLTRLALSQIFVNEAQNARAARI